MPSCHDAMPKEQLAMSLLPNQGRGAYRYMKKWQKTEEASHAVISWNYISLMNERCLRHVNLRVVGMYWGVIHHLILTVNIRLRIAGIGQSVVNQDEGTPESVCQ